MEKLRKLIIVWLNLQGCLEGEVSIQKQAHLNLEYTLKLSLLIAGKMIQYLNAMSQGIVGKLLYTIRMLLG